MKVKWLAEDREIPVPRGDGTVDLVEVSRRKGADLPDDIAASLVEQGLAEKADTPKAAKAAPRKRAAKKTQGGIVTTPVRTNDREGDEGVIPLTSEENG